MTPLLQDIPEFRSKSQALYFALNLYYRPIDHIGICEKAKKVYDMILKELPSLPELAPGEPATYPFDGLNDRKFSHGNFVHLREIPILDVMESRQEQPRNEDMNDGCDECPATTATENTSECPCGHPCEGCDEVPEDKRPLYESPETPMPGTDA